MKESDMRRLVREEPREGSDRDDLTVKAGNIAQQLDATRFRQRVLGRLGFEAAADHLQYIDRMHDIGYDVPQSSFHKSEVRDKLASIVDDLITTMGKREFTEELMMALPTREVKNFVSR